MDPIILKEFVVSMIRTALVTLIHLFFCFGTEPLQGAPIECLCRDIVGVIEFSKLSDFDGSSESKACFTIYGDDVSVYSVPYSVSNTNITSLLKRLTSLRVRVWIAAHMAIGP